MKKKKRDIFRHNFLSLSLFDHLLLSKGVGGSGSGQRQYKGKKKDGDGDDDDFFLSRWSTQKSATKSDAHIASASLDKSSCASSRRRRRPPKARAPERARLGRVEEKDVVFGGDDSCWGYVVEVLLEE